MEREEGNNIENLRKMGLDRFSYPLYRDKVVGLYMHAYASGEYAQQIEQAEAEESLWTTIRYGFGQLAFDGQQLVGAVLAMPLEKHTDFPALQTSGIDPKSTLYIAEVMVHSDYRRRGVATMLMKEVLARLAGYSATMIRVWEENRTACNLYKKLAFRPIAAITQTKRRPSGEPFEMRKLYFLK